VRGTGDFADLFADVWSTFRRYKSIGCERKRMKNCRDFCRLASDTGILMLAAFYTLEIK
jgi:hypothetical protein